MTTTLPIPDYARPAEVKFDPPRRHTVTHTLAELYHRCRNLGMEIWLDYQIKNAWGRKFRVSAVVVYKERIACFVWIRSSYNAARNPTKKRHRIDRLGVPLVVVRGMPRLQAALDEIKMHFNAARAASEETTPPVDDVPFEGVAPSE